MKSSVLILILCINLKLKASAAQEGLEAAIDEVFGDHDEVTETILNEKEEKPNSNDCECVPYYLCYNDSIIDNGVGLIDIRLNSGTCEHYLDVCCQPPDVLKGSKTTTQKPILRNGCGTRNSEGIGFRITGNNNNEAEFGEFPWMIAVLHEETVPDQPEVKNVFQCGGSLIHPQAVITAAHCIKGKDTHKLKIRAGEWDTQTKDELYHHQDRAVETIRIHEKYYAGGLHNDIALLILKTPFDLAPNVDVVCLPEQDTVLDHSRCFASGWGKDVFGKDGIYQVILKKVDLPIVPRDECLEALRNTRLGPTFKLHESFICAGGEENKDTCKGDGGSPLVCPIINSDRYEQAGIVAWGVGCGEDRVPGVYVNVAHFRRWIDEQMTTYNLDTDYYRNIDLAT